MSAVLNTILKDLAGRLTDTLDGVADGLDQQTAERVPAPGTNSICWLLWHSARCIDQQLHGLIGGTQLWQQWKPRLAIPLPDDRLGLAEIGYAQDPADAARVSAPVADLEAYLRECCSELVAHCATVDEPTLATIVDRDWDPPVTHGARLVSIVADVAQHLGAAAYLRGMLNASHD
ncbi:DUF664 domain-containing protein [Naumannella sp. ID2617S]|nr:DUF664 domain-containing protein [Naumannella sp. ID2617S]